MKRMIGLACVLMFLCSGCGDTHESLAGDSIGVMKDVVSTLEGITDVDTAKSAKPKLEKLAAKLKDLNARQAKLGVPTEADLKTMDKYSKDMEEIGRKMFAQQMRLMSDPKVAAVLNDVNLRGS